MPKRRFLRHEILMALLIKFLILWGLWALFFSHPIDKTLIPNDIASHLLKPTATRDL